MAMGAASRGGKQWSDLIPHLKRKARRCCKRWGIRKVRREGKREASQASE